MHYFGIPRHMVKIGFPITRFIQAHVVCHRKITIFFTAADIWLWACQFYVLAAFLEFGLVNWLGRRDATLQRKREEAEEKEREEAGIKIEIQSIVK